MTESALTTGRLPSLRVIWRLAWPVLLLSLVERLAGMYEGVLVSVSNPDDLAAMSLAAPYYSLLTTVGAGMAIGVNAVVGSMNGAGQWRIAGRSAAAAVWKLLLVSSLILSLVILLVMPLSFAGEEAAGLYPLGLRYLLPILIGSPFLFFFTALVSMMQGMGHTKAGMWMTILSAPLNLLLCALFYPAMGLLGLGLAMLIAKIIGCGLGWHIYQKRMAELNAEAGETDRREVSRRILRLCVPASLSKAVSPFASLVLNGMMLSVGAAVLSADGLGRRFEMLFYLSAVALSPVAISLVSRCREQDPGLLKPLTGRLVLSAVVPAGVLYLLAAVFAEPIWAALTPDPAIREAGVLYTRIFGASYPLIAADLIFASVLNGLGTSVPMLLSTILRMWIVTLPCAAFFRHIGWGPEGFWWALFLGNLAAAGYSGIALLYRLKNHTGGGDPNDERSHTVGGTACGAPGE